MSTSAQQRSQPLSGVAKVAMMLEVLLSIGALAAASS